MFFYHCCKYSRAIYRKAPQAKFWLYQTEDNSSEYPIEEFNWACGAEKADSSGADVISSSLGYATFDDASLNHTYADMNGNTTMAVIAADLAAKKEYLYLFPTEILEQVHGIFYLRR
jgi:hypothetical protein